MALEVAGSNPVGHPIFPLISCSVYRGRGFESRDSFFCPYSASRTGLLHRHHRRGSGQRLSFKVGDAKVTYGVKAPTFLQTERKGRGRPVSADLLLY